ncbi:MAG: hypothetical protein ACRC7N_04410 [Clostridium sp.]
MNKENIFEINGDVTLITAYKKNGGEVKCKIDTEDLEKVKAIGNFFAEWNKDYNSYLIQNISKSKVNKKSKPLKQGIQTIVMDVAATTPINYINGDTLDNRKCNLKVYDRNEKNGFEVLDEDTIAILLRDRYGNVKHKALISSSDKNLVLGGDLVWTTYKKGDTYNVVANTTEGRIYLDRFILSAMGMEKVTHINLNPLDNRRKNLELVELEEE